MYISLHHYKGMSYFKAFKHQEAEKIFVAGVGRYYLMYVHFIKIMGA